MQLAQEIEIALFETALNIGEAATREAFLAQACGSDRELRNRLEKLLGTAKPAARFFENAAEARAPVSAQIVSTGADVAAGAAPPAPEPVTGADTGGGTRIGPYELLQRIGEGGCGVVYLAEQQEPVRRRIALKIIRAGMDTERVIARFSAERQALAMMDHPNIAHVLDAGATDSGRPFFVMDLVHGSKITDFCNENHFDTRQRIELFIQVCHAIQHAHQKGVIHRDIKPSNVLVSLHDGVAVPKVIDFGIAKATSTPLADLSTITLAGELIGTPAYMSPEQAETGGLDVDTRSDIYSLGVLLYELLTGRTPFSNDQLLESGVDKMRHTLTRIEPPLPSTVLMTLPVADLETVANAQRTEPLRLISTVGGDLDWIVMKALEKDRQRRYETVNALANDLRRYLAYEPVQARPPSPLYRFGKFVRRNRIAFSAGAVAVAALVAGLSASTWMFFREREARQQQIALRQEAEHGQAAKTELLRQSMARENIALAAVLLSQHKLQEADAVIRETPLGSVSPSFEAAGVFRALGEWNALYGRWRQAADCFTLLMEANRGEDPAKLGLGSDLLECGPALLEAGDASGYERFRENVLSRSPQTRDPSTAEHIVKTCLLLPADPAFLKRLEPLCATAQAGVSQARPAAAETDLVAWRALALCLFACRQGDFTNAIILARKSLALSQAHTARTAALRAILCMSYHGVGQADEAHSAFVAARDLLGAEGAGSWVPFTSPHKETWYSWSVARLLFREAANLTGEQAFPETSPE
jgi:serine/threonine protein kinase